MFRESTRHRSGARSIFWGTKATLPPKRKRTTTGTNNCKFEVADIFREHIRDYLKVYKMSRAQFEVVSDIIGCRTEWLGGRIRQCSQLRKGKSRSTIPAGTAIARNASPWQRSAGLKKRKSEVLPVKYFHNVFTVPHDLNPDYSLQQESRNQHSVQIRIGNPAAIRREPGQRTGRGNSASWPFFIPRTQGAPGPFSTSISSLPRGALSADGENWIACEYDWLFPERALSKVFRGKFMFHLQKAYDKAELAFPGNTAKYATSNGFRQLKNVLWSKTWVVDVEPPLDNPDRVIDYVGRYTHRVAISNCRILDLSDGKVAFSYKNRKKGTVEAMTIERGGIHPKISSSHASQRPDAHPLLRLSRQPLQKRQPEKMPEKPRRLGSAGLGGAQNRPGNHDGEDRARHNEVPVLQERRSGPPFKAFRRARERVRSK